ncbi:hypothetical protein A9Q74_05940 [Colwellia sp. 39_35_sub15_T18]|nr:hypothetical protein A9Q74_05940 [Colwellia sp. 39_35_sub15_T18]
MLSSIILSMAMSVSPAPIADTHSLDIQEIGKARGSMRINAEQDLTIEKAGKARGSMRINSKENLSIEKAGKARGSMRI